MYQTVLLNTAISLSRSISKGKCRYQPIKLTD